MKRPSIKLSRVAAGVAAMLFSMIMFFGCSREKAPVYPSDVITAADGSEITLTFFEHASLAIEWQGSRVYVDPVGGKIAYDKLPKADVILITHSHYDHFDLETVEKLSTDKTVVVCDRESVAAFEYDCTTMTPGAVTEPVAGLNIRAVPAYNISEGHTQFHPKEREDCGYVLTLGGTTIYIAGDTEDNEDVLALSGIDIAFLPVNQPYTMTVDQAVRTVKAIQPKIFYPYHYGQVEERTDIARLVRELDGVCEVRVRPME